MAAIPKECHDLLPLPLEGLLCSWSYFAYRRCIDGPAYRFAQTPQSQRYPEIERVGHIPTCSTFREFFVAWSTSDDCERRHRSLPNSLARQEWQPQSAGRRKPRAFAYLSFQRSSRPVQHLHRGGHRQPRKPYRFWQSYDRLRRDAGRVLGRASCTTRRLHTYMTNVVPGTGGPRQSDTRFSPPHCAVWTLLGRSRSGAWSDD